MRREASWAPARGRTHVHAAHGSRRYLGVAAADNFGPRPAWRQHCSLTGCSGLLSMQGLIACRAKGCAHQVA